MSESRVGASYLRRVFELPAADLDTLTALLWAEGALGFEVDDAGPDPIRLVGWFATAAAPALGPLAGRAREVAAAEVADRDWLADYRASAAPIAAGRFVVDPGDPGEGGPADLDPRYFLRIPARTAFGTGSHESTRLVMELLGAVPVAGRDVLDVGTGSGLLALACLRLGARRAVGFDVDGAAVLLAGANARLNGYLFGVRGAARFPGGFVAGGLAAFAAVPRFDLALVNVIPEEVLAEYPAILARLRSGARIVSSGNLLERRDELRARFAGLGLAVLAERTAGEWIAFVLGRVTETT